MNKSNLLNFSCRIDNEENEYMGSSLDHIEEQIISILDIVEVARRLGIELVELPKDAEEREEYDYDSSDIYTGTCPQCSCNGLRIFGNHQSFGCIECEWSGEFDNTMDIFELLSWKGFDNNQQDQIQKLFELFPNELNFLKGQHLNRYEYNWNYFELAEEYYKGIEKDLAKKDAEYVIYEKEKYQRIVTDIHGIAISNYDLSRKINEIEKVCKKLNFIIQAYKIVNDIYARREKVDNLLHGKSIQEIVGCDPDEECNDCNIAFGNESKEIEEEKIVYSCKQIKEEGEKLIEEEKIKKQQKEEKERIRLEKQEAERIRIETERIKLETEKKEKSILLLGDINNQEQTINNFFNTCKYQVNYDGDILKSGDLGKFVVVYEKNTFTFSVVFSKYKGDYPTPETFKMANRLINNMDGVGLHRDISILEGLKRFGGGQYIMLPDNNILIGGSSGDFGRHPGEIVKKCLEEAGYKVHNINESFSNYTVYEKILSDICFYEGN